jgi:hypothetical protein
MMTTFGKSGLVFVLSFGVTGGAGGGPIEVTSPSGEERWSADSKHYITWKSAAGVTTVKVEYSLDGGRSWATVPEGERAASAPGVVNRLLWKVPLQVSSQCKVRISSADDASVKAETAVFHIIPSQEAGYRWTEVTLKTAFAGRDGAGALTFKDKMWLLGGWNPGDKVHFPKICNSEVWSSVDGLTWTLENPQAPWEGRHTAGYAVHKGKMWIVGGDANQRHYQNDVWSSEDGVNWKLVCGDVPWRNRVLHYTLVHDGRIWVMGGQSLPQFGPATEVFYNDVWNSEDGANWTRVIEHAPWTPRGMIGGSAVFKGRMWLLGGGTYDTPEVPRRKFYNDVWSSPDGTNWTCHTESAPWAARQYHDVAVFDDRMWVLEGYDGTGNRNDVWHSADGVNWRELPDTPWKPRHAGSVFVHDRALWLVAGNHMESDVWKLVRRKDR